MNLALIAIGLFFILGFIQKARIAAKNKKEKSRTKTNVELQNKIEKAIDAIILSDIERLAASGLSRNDLLDRLHEKYNVPRLSDVRNSAFQWSARKHDLFFNLRKLLVKREMSRLGYVYSHGGKESDWQESQSAYEKFKDIKSKYPWL